MPGRSPRQVAFEILLDYSRRDAYLNILLSSRLSASGLDVRDRSLVTELVQGTVRMKETLDWALSDFSAKTLDTLDPEVLWALRLSVYQIMYTDIPEYAAVDTGVQLAKDRTGRGGGSYVNAVLRSLVDGWEDLSWPEPGRDPVEYLVTRYSHPGWLVRMWIEEMGFSRTESICRADNRAPMLSVRCNLCRARRHVAANSLAVKGFTISESDLVPEGLLLAGGGPVNVLEEYIGGLISVQDEGSILVGHVLGPAPGMRVIDLCAAPGGKTNHIAELMKNKGEVVAIDINAEKLSMLEDNAARLGNRIIEAVRMDATEAASAIENGFDRVLVDAPCTGLGTLARRPDIRWRREEEDIERLAELQSAILDQGAMLVRPGGVLVYSTCTISRRENQGVVEAFLKRNKEFRLSEPEIKVEHGGQEPYIQLFPDINGCDGMFMAQMVRLQRAG